MVRARASRSSDSAKSSKRAKRPNGLPRTSGKPARRCGSSRQAYGPSRDPRWSPARVFGRTLRRTIRDVLRVVYGIGDALVWLERRPRTYWALAMGIIWTVGTLGLHYIPRWYGGTTYTLGWGQALGTAFVVALIGTAFAFYISRARL